MKSYKNILVLVQALFILITGCTSNKQSINPKHKTTSFQNKTCLLDACNKPTKNILDILDYYHLEHNGSLEDIVFKINGYPWHKNTYFSDRTFPKQLFENIGFMQTICPQKNYYDYALLLGGYANEVQNRIQFMHGLWQQGIRFRKLIILSSTRPINKTLEQPTLKGLSIPKNEAEMIHTLLDSIQMSKGFKKIERTYIIARFHKNKNGSIALPTLNDSIKLWLKDHPKPGKVLAISNQPNVSYHRCLLTKIFNQNFYIDIVGSEAESSIPPITYLKTIADILNLEYKHES